MDDVTTAARVSLRKIALPVEHGAWGFLLEPALLGLLLAPSAAGVALVVAALAALLLQTPLSLALADARRGRRYPRTVVAWRLAAGYAAVLASAGLLALALAGTSAVLWPVLLATPWVVVQLVYDARNRGRQALPEVSGALAMGALASSVAIAGGWALAPALALWGLLAARTVPSILYVRARLRLERGQPAAVAPVWAAHAGALLAVAGAAAVGWVPVSASLAYVVLAVRAVWGVSERRSPRPAKVIGFRELGYGVFVVLVIVLGYALGV